MRNMLQAVVSVALLAGLGVVAEAGTIDFDDGADGSSIGAFYAGQGVTFTNGSWTDNFALAGSSGPLGLSHTVDFFQPTVVSPIIATFATGVSSVSIVAIDVGDRGARIDAYDSVVGGTLVAFDQNFGVGLGIGTFFTLSAGAGSIRRIELYQPNPIASGDGMLWDHLTFETAAVPLPTSALMGLGLLGGLGIALRLRKRKPALIA